MVYVYIYILEDEETLLFYLFRAPARLR